MNIAAAPALPMTGPVGDAADTTLLYIALATTVLFHGALLPFTHGNTYDAFIHMFFGDHYHRSWFDPWEPRWYTGFATTSYPPGTHMAQGLLMHVVPLRTAFVIVQLCGLLLLTVGIYRFSLIWVTPRAAGYAAIVLPLSSSIVETVHIFGQLPTIFSLGVFLNGLPYIYRWLAGGGWFNFTAAVIFSAATTAAHHVTTIFGSVLFVIPLGLQALQAILAGATGPTFLHRLGFLIRPVGRGIMLACAMAFAMVLTVFPYWYWSVTDPITQVPIPHGSRENFLDRLDLGLMFFLLPWGIWLLLLPYVAYKTLTTRIWPLGASVFVCFVLGTGGTTPLPRMILGGAFDILTLDRFTFWATILILPFVGHFLDGLLSGRLRNTLEDAFGRGLRRFLTAGIFVSLLGVAVFIAVLPTMRPTQPDFVDPDPIVRFLAEDEHDRWRYLTLGFGDQFAYMSALTQAKSIDGNYHSVRRLPDFTRYSVERLENAKYLGVPGLGSLKQFLVNAERYNLKYVFSNDAFYDPLLFFTGWTRLNRLGNGIVVWEKPDISPLPLFELRREIPRAHALMWGSLPPAFLFMAGMIFAASVVNRNFRHYRTEFRPVVERANRYGNPRRLRNAVLVGGAVAGIGAVALGTILVREFRKPTPAAQTVAAYFEHLDFRRYAEAYAMLDPQTRPEFDEVMFDWRWRGGLLASFGKLADAQISDISDISERDDLIDWSVRLDWLTALGLRSEDVTVRTVRRDGHWFLVPLDMRRAQTPVRLQRESSVAWNVVGRRQARADTDLHRDRLDRPRIAVDGARLIKRGERYFVVGQITNADADPAAVSIFSDLLEGDRFLARQSVGEVSGHRLLPAESAGFRVDFEGVLALDQAVLGDEFDPTMFIPPELDGVPSDARIEARALVVGRDLYRGVALNDIRVEPDGQGLAISGLAVNTGIETATIARVNLLLFDIDGKPVWAESHHVQDSIYPGQSAQFDLRLPPRSDLSVLAEVGQQGIVTNGSVMQADLPLPRATDGTIPLDPNTGFSALRIHVSAMTHDPLF